MPMPIRPIESYKECPCCSTLALLLVDPLTGLTTDLCAECLDPHRPDQLHVRRDSCSEICVNYQWPPL
jgi:hypothetical protein